jgi:hypothetical protein
MFITKEKLPKTLVWLYYNHDPGPQSVVLVVVTTTATMATCWSTSEEVWNDRNQRVRKAVFSNRRIDIADLPWRRIAPLF